MLFHVTNILKIIKRGFKSSLSSRNLDNDVEDEVEVDALVNAVDEQNAKFNSSVL